ncbi:MAG TPA: alpha/beta hydrolase-fold protein [Mucilaginibacter sp.]|nr:alpha/beta hydrolase-fold protein [Mucilaginibacter sp.]
MRHLIWPVLLVLLASCKRAEKSSSDIIAGKIDSLYSKTLGEERKIWVYLPAGYTDAGNKQIYPVIYLLDGDAHFPSVTGMIQQLSEVNGNTICPDMIVVGIPNTDRTRDLTPTKSLFNPDGSRARDFGTSGGGEKFEAFIQNELMRHIDSTYRTAPYKMLIGHSFGGLTAMNILLNHTNMFNSYVAIDPSMWWDKHKLLDQARETLKQSKFAGRSLYLAIANTMPDGMDTLQVRLDTTGATNHIRSILALKDLLTHNNGDGLKWDYKYYKDDNHGSVPLIAEYDALHFLFGFYKMPRSLSDKLFDSKAKFDPASAFSSHYAEISDHMGYKILPPESLMNQLAYYYMQSGLTDRAYSLFALNVANYPQSANVYDSMGDYYDSQKNKDKAIEYYNKALKLDNNPGTKKKLDKLQSAK